MRHRAGERLRLLREEVGLYLVLVNAAFRSAAQYRVSLLMYTLVEMAGAMIDLAAISIIFAHLPDLKGFSLAEVGFLYGTSALAFALAEMMVGPLDLLGWHVKEGRLDPVLIRPVSVLVQAATMDFSPQRLGRLVQPVAVLAVSLAALDVSWSPVRVLLLPIMVGSGTLIALGLAVAVAAVLFVAPDSSVAVAAIRQGSALATQYPLTVFGRRPALLMTVVLPIAFVNWQPALFILARPDPLGLPEATRFLSPAMAVLSCAVAAAAWRSGVRHYRSEGG
ncbi:ABC-2 type transport system permease protein [Frankia sp. EI5c]|uniref:ABC transporter permease n=1 Tax=Frankia sp. EI5c TaxID=683316 RepID=UPI0007C4072D|nr:ABC-2 family transporter protein [Frankia sp. EI5c]OAA28208.1 ABC-2 type transport system permease protein [Frankia sp. EI5c]